jgi:hypothetical protein
VVGTVDLAERLEEFFAVPPAIGFGAEEGKPLGGVAKESRHVFGKMGGGNAVDITVTFFAPGAGRTGKNTGEAHG